MASALKQYHQLADHMATQITSSYQSWTYFLTTAARLYKYPYHEQLMIYAQRPEATACADYELWNNFCYDTTAHAEMGVILFFSRLAKSIFCPQL